MTGSDGGERLAWQALVALLLAMFAIAVGYGMFLPILPLLIERLGGKMGAASLSRHIGLLTGAYTLALFLFAPIWGRISDRLDRRSLILLGLLGFALSLASFALIDSLPLLYLSRFASGLFSAAIPPAAYSLVGDLAPSKEWRAHPQGLLSAAGATGLLVGPTFGGLVLRAAGALAPGTEVAVSVPFFAMSSLALLAALAVGTSVPGVSRRGTRRVQAHDAQDDQAVRIRLLAIGFLTALAVGAFEVGLALRGRQVLGLGAYQIGMMFTECSLVMLVAQSVVLSPLVSPAATRWLLTPGLVILALGLGAVPWASGYASTVLAVAAVAASAGLVSPIVTYWISLDGGEAQGAALGQQTAAASLGQTLGSGVGGLLFNVSVIPNAAFTTTAVIVLAGLSASIGLHARLARTERKHSAPASS